MPYPNPHGGPPNKTQRYVPGKAGRIGKIIPADSKSVPTLRSNPKSRRARRT